jgi:hypothetical protein
MSLKSFLLTGCMLSGIFVNAQDWATRMQQPDANFYEVRDEFEKHWSTRDKTEKGKGYKVFRRWEYFVESRVYPSGELNQLKQTAENFKTFVDDYNLKTGTGKVIGSGNNLIASATWTPMGPFGAISGSGQGQLLKSGRINFITIDPTNSNNLWVGAPAGGLWKSTNGGTSWTTNTDNLSVIGCSDLAIDPSNTSIMYLATGDGDSGDSPSIGVLKSTDGGNTWSITGLVFTKSSNASMRRLIINPTNTQILIAATSQGIYRTTNGGTNWTLVASGSTHDLEFKPNDPNTIYAGGGSFRLSTNGGSSFITISSGIPTGGVGRMAVAVTSADPTYVYVLAANNSNGGFQGFYRSTTSGTGFTLMANTPNLLGWSSTGSDTGGQGWYDLCAASSPLNKDEVVIGGVNVWRSTNGGSSWALYGHWTGSGAPFTHADHHDLEFTSTGTLYNTNDGTVYRRTTTGWQEICGNMNISQIYRLGLSSLTANRWITGHQDNGTSIFNGSTYNAELGGDGMDCFYDRTNNNNVFAEYYNGELMKSTNGGSTWSSCTNGLTGTGPWVTAWKQDPQNATTLYCGYSNLFRSTDLAGSWSQLTALPAGGSIREFAIAPSNNQVIYVLKSAGIYKTTNGGTSWTTVTNGVPVNLAAPQYISIDPNDPNNAWVVLSGYSSGNKVFVTTNGGTSWTNVSSNLPNIPANCIVYEPGTSDRIYVGMDVGVYYRDANASSWTLYNTSLPNVPISELEISPANSQFLYASTYGRGVWMANVASAVAAPVSLFGTDPAVCTNTGVVFSDQSSNLPTSWSWSVTPSAGVTISSTTTQNPVFNFSSAGTYTVKLQATNNLGPGSVYTKTVSVTGSPVLTISASAATVCTGASVTYTASGATNYTWSSWGGYAPAAIYSPSASTVYSVTGFSNGCYNTKTVAVSAIPAPVVNLTGDTLVCEGHDANFSAQGASTYSWSTGATGASIVANLFVSSFVTVVGSNGVCSASKMHYVKVLPGPQLSWATDREAICDNDSVTLYASGGTSYTWSTGETADQVGITAHVGQVFTVTGTAPNGCTSDLIIYQNVDACVSIGEFSEGGMSIYPNPAHASFVIKGLESNQPATVSILDLSGRQLMNVALHKSSSDRVEISISHLPIGVYVLKVSAEGLVPKFARLVKE